MHNMQQKHAKFKDPICSICKKMQKNARKNARKNASLGKYAVQVYVRVYNLHNFANYAQGTLLTRMAAAGMPPSGPAALLSPTCAGSEPPCRRRSRKSPGGTRIRPRARACGPGILQLAAGPLAVKEPVTWHGPGPGNVISVTE